MNEWVGGWEGGKADEWMKDRQKEEVNSFMGDQTRWD